jgi:hypothetical protein
VSVQQEVLLWARNEKGEKVAYCCENCGRQRLGVVLNIITRTMLSCACEQLKSRSMKWDFSDVTP